MNRPAGSNLFSPDCKIAGQIDALYFGTVPFIGIVAAGHSAPEIKGQHNLVISFLSSGVISAVRKARSR